MTGFWTGAGVRPGPEVATQSRRSFPGRAAQLDAAAAPRAAPERNMATVSSFSDLTTQGLRTLQRDPLSRKIPDMHSGLSTLQLPEDQHAD